MNFEQAAEKAKSLPNTVTNEEKLSLYGLYKQATIGDVNTDQPWAVQIESRAKHDAWASHKGKSQDDAKTEYIAQVEALLAKYGC